MELLNVLRSYALRQPFPEIAVLPMYEQPVLRLPGWFATRSTSGAYGWYAPPGISTYSGRFASTKSSSL
ncbi:MAG: hypothetical protein ACYC66_16850 [Chloroflexota bacterium]